MSNYWTPRCMFNAYAKTSQRARKLPDLDLADLLPAAASESEREDDPAFKEIRRQLQTSLNKVRAPGGTYSLKPLKARYSRMQEQLSARRARVRRHSTSSREIEGSSLATATPQDRSPRSPLSSCFSTWTSLPTVSCSASPMASPAMTLEELPKFLGTAVEGIPTLSPAASNTLWSRRKRYCRTEGAIDSPRIATQNLSPRVAIDANAGICSDGEKNGTANNNGPVSYPLRPRRKLHTSEQGRRRNSYSFGDDDKLQTFCEHPLSAPVDLVSPSSLRSPTAPQPAGISPASLPSNNLSDVGESRSDESNGVSSVTFSSVREKATVMMERARGCLKVASEETPQDVKLSPASMMSPRANLRVSFCEVLEKYKDLEDGRMLQRAGTPPPTSGKNSHEWSADFLDSHLALPLEELRSSPTGSDDSPSTRESALKMAVLAKMGRQKHRTQRRWGSIRSSLRHGRMSDAGLDLALDAAAVPNGESELVWQLKQKRHFVLLDDIEVLPERVAFDDEVLGSRNEDDDEGVLQQTIPKGTYGIMKAFMVQELTPTEKKRLQKTLLKRSLDTPTAKNEKNILKTRISAALARNSNQINDSQSIASGATSMSRKSKVSASTEGCQLGVARRLAKLSLFAPPIMETVADIPPDVDDQCTAPDDDLQMPVLKLHFFGQHGLDVFGAGMSMDQDEESRAINSGRSDCSSDMDSECGNSVAQEDLDVDVDFMMQNESRSGSKKSCNQSDHGSKLTSGIELNEATVARAGRRRSTFSKAITSGTYYYPLHPGHAPLSETFACV